MVTYPGTYAVPGSMWPGEIRPGMTLVAGNSGLASTGGLVRKRKSVRAVWQSGYGKLNAVPPPGGVVTWNFVPASMQPGAGVPGLPLFSPVSGVVNDAIAYRSARKRLVPRAVWHGNRGLLNALPPPLGTAATGGLIRGRTAYRAAWRSNYGTVNAPPPAGTAWTGYAVPGAMWPGVIVPGMTLAGGGSTPATPFTYLYNDADEYIFPDYLESSDGLHWTTLVAVPQMSYNYIISVSAHTAALPGGGYTWVLIPG